MTKQRYFRKIVLQKHIDKLSFGVKSLQHITVRITKDQE